MTEPFASDPRIQHVAEAYSLDAVDFAKSAFNIQLDRSDESVRHVETILGTLHEQLAAVRPDSEKVYGFAKMLGSYVGEVFRKNHGATWGMVTLNGETFPGMKASGSGKLFWPWGRAQKRILSGPEDNIWHYYLLLTGHAEPVAIEAGPHEDGSPQHVPWWKRIFRG